MKRFPYALLLIIFLLTSCGGLGAVSPTDTAAPPSDTPPPTSTPLPTDTPTPVPTSTPDAAATAAAQATASAASVLDELDRLLGESDVPYMDGHLAWQQTEPAKITMQGPQYNNQFLSIDEDLVAKNFVFKSDVIWNGTGIMVCGALFRSEANLERGKQYQFYFYRLSGLPAYFIDVYEDPSFKNTITDAKFSDELDISNDATNQFVLVAQDNQFNIYLNGKRQGRYFDNSKQRSEGYFGFMAWQESGTGSCEFENSWVWSLDE
ncbi:MAG TPA: hypothetical protein VMJ90_03105 [Anaerolineales bacterium]|nr:hypothetical protein [Anaerolineales bacterium]